MIIYVPSSGDPRKPQPAAGRWSGADHKKLMLLGCLCILSGVIEIARVFIRDSLLGNPHPSAIAGSAIGGLVVWAALRAGTGYGFGWLGARLWVCALASMSLSAVDIVVSAAALLLKGEPQQLPSPLIFLAAAVTLVFDALLGVGGGWLGSTRQAGRPVAIGCATVLLVAGGLVTIALFKWNPLELPQAPPELQKPEVRLGQGLLQKSVFISDDELGNVTDMILDPLPGARFGVAGVKGAVFLKPDRTPLSHVNFESPQKLAGFGFPLNVTYVQFLDLDGHHNWAFLNRGGNGWQDASLIGPDGKTLWVCGGQPAVDDMTAGNLGSDGAPQFVVGFNGGGGLRCLNVKNELQWEKPGRNIWHVEIVDIDGKGQPKIVHTDASGGFTIRNRKGDIEREMKPVEYSSEFSVCRWPAAKSSPKLVIPGKEQIWLADFDGKVIGEFKARSWQGSSREIHATVCRLKKDEPPYLVTVTNYSLWNVSVLALFNSERQPIYEEIITEQCASLLALPHEGAAVDDLLVGGNGKVWRYTAAETAVGKKK